MESIVKAATQEKIICIITSIALAVTYFIAGFAVCVGVPYVTQFLSEQNSVYESTPFTEQQINKLAMATRDYTVGSHNLDALMSEISKANAEASTQYAQASQEELLTDVPDEYTLNESAIAHLDDVNELVSTLYFPMFGVVAIATFCFMAMFKMFGTKPVGKALFYSGVAVLIAFAVIGICALVGFSGFFAGIHALFFQPGTWVFPVDSLLISMYPQSFWIGMGLCWLIVSCVLAALSIVFGRIILKRQTDSSK
ncbi:DUF1461 domain-containing protein [Adlercreutzia sp. ZJ304]|uniref:lipoprotein intramolecular transacylase Lit n=1 Tax=Adlercreutzia sp. ZJ304 TaxID=2709791 RepID=UPI0013EE2466|nr:DUF1461 domain-containing protein [Adlercreutzia sp. ZJ304]